MEENTETYKLFVGNVPFKCTSEEFGRVFEEEQGFTNAELIYRTKSELTRGFGFVEWESEESLNKVLNKRFTMDDRELRVAKYFDEMKNNHNEYNNERTYKLFVRNTNDLSVNDLRECFTKFGDVIECYLLLDRETQESKGNGVVGFEDRESWENALHEKDFNVNNTTVTVYPFKYKQRYNKPVHKGDTKALYRNGYNDGMAAGYNKGYDEGYNNGYDDNANGDERNSKKNYMKRPFLKNVVNNS